MLIDARFDSYRLLGIDVHAFTSESMSALLAEALAARRRTIITNHNLHSVYLYQRDEAMRQLMAKSYIHIDGMPLVFWGRLMGHPLRRDHRVTWIDWMPLLLKQAAEAKWRVFYLGAPLGVAQRAADVLREQYQGLTLLTHHGHFDQTPGSEANDAVIAAINAANADVLLVGMGMPRQEQWVLANADRLEAPAILTCGAAIEYFAGSMRTPPRWMGRCGLEWLYRLGSDPGRLWRRYLVEPWRLSGPLRDVYQRIRRR